ncbi:non-structural maintenance of chromosomes element 4 homolog A-like [Lampris incognitus]|uniref:non-structural maintenance of chromosomes element 4 homolog A-like n=1 Tax=Lampris incognitus TaxID=2546036 RepID=UPI0024B4FEA3|nr:non-structural maintenance of chromosomes element 4 homolog A-like [Lampris incognitus]
MRRGRDGGDEEASPQSAGAAAAATGGGRRDGVNGRDLGGILSNATEEDDDPALRREIRSKYRNLISSVKQNREDMLNPTNDSLSKVLDEANKLFKDVRQPREAALDAQLLVVATDVGREKANQLCAEGIAFDPSVFAEHLLSFMGLNRLENEEEDQENGFGNDGYLCKDAWHRLAKRTQSCFRTAPTFHYMMGSFHAEPPPPKQRVERQKKAPSMEAKRIMPTQLKKMEESQQEATEKEVERILGYLRGYFEEDSSSPISYYEFVIDPNSFSRTVENIFHTSFLIRDGLAMMYLDDDELPCIAPVVEGAAESAATGSSKQCIIAISPKSWRELIDLLDIREPLIQPLNPENE